MRSIHLEKKGLRGLAIAESFRQNSKRSILSGLIMRKDFVIDGFVFGSATLESNDATDQILRMYERLHRSDISYILISGLIISMYNVVDIKKLCDSLQIPIIGITYTESVGIEVAIKYHFPKYSESKINEYKKLGKRQRITLHTSHDLFVRCEGCTIYEVKQLLNKLTLQGAIPEPIRVSQLLANVLLQKQN
ncbi:hypothetical protein YTPLAS73_04400 [Nitrosarchaeum sp.]|nr:hypothetical protein YTPLAS73_04400 [Nitrosarchaeum sp.]